jgi:hypothetical protein
MTEDSDVADLRTRIDSLMDKKSKTSKGFTVDNYLYINLITNYSYGIAYRVGGH